MTDLENHESRLQEISENIKQALQIRKDLLLRRITILKDSKSLAGGVTVDSVTSALKACSDREGTFLDILTKSYAGTLRMVEEIEKDFEVAKPTRNIKDALTFVNRELVRYDKEIEDAKARVALDKMAADTGRPNQERYDALERANGMLEQEIKREVKATQQAEGRWKEVMILHKELGAFLRTEVTGAAAGGAVGAVAPAVYLLHASSQTLPGVLSGGFTDKVQAGAAIGAAVFGTLGIVLGLYLAHKSFVLEVSKAWLKL